MEYAHAVAFGHIWMHIYTFTHIYAHFFPCLKLRFPLFEALQIKQFYLECHAPSFFECSVEHICAVYVKWFSRSLNIDTWSCELSISSCVYMEMSNTSWYGNQMGPCAGIAARNSLSEIIVAPLCLQTSVGCNVCMCVCECVCVCVCACVFSVCVCVCVCTTFAYSGRILHSSLKICLYLYIISFSFSLCSAMAWANNTRPHPPFLCRARSLMHACRLAPTSI